MERLEAESGLRHLVIANARLRKPETREFAQSHPELVEALRAWLVILKSTVEWLEDR